MSLAIPLDRCRYTGKDGHMMRATYRGVGPYRGVVKNDSGEVVAECEHWHRNRDTSSRFAGQAARECANGMLRELDPEAWRASLPNWMKEAR